MGFSKNQIKTEDSQTHLRCLRNVDTFTSLCHVAYDALSPRNPYDVVTSTGGKAVRTGVGIKYFGHKGLFALVSLHEKQGASIGVQQDTDVHQYTTRQAFQVQLVRDILDDLQEEVSLVQLA